MSAWEGSQAQCTLCDGVFGHKKDCQRYTPPRTAAASTLATEDERFREHSGVDLRGTARAAMTSGRTGLPQVSAPRLVGKLLGKAWKTRRAIREISLEELKTRLESRADFTLVDVREGDEYRAGYIPGALHIPRGHLESKAEGLLHRKDAPVIVYCAGGTRSALAARTLQEMGYSNVESANPGYSQWKDRRYPMEVPRVLTADQRERYSRHLLLPDGVGVTLDARRWPRPVSYTHLTLPTNREV